MAEVAAEESMRREREEAHHLGERSAAPDAALRPCGRTQRRGSVGGRARFYRARLGPVP